MSSNDRVILSEHDAFRVMTESLDQAAAAAREMMRLRPDQSRAWEMLSNTFKVNSMAVWRLAEESVQRNLKGG